MRKTPWLAALSIVVCVGCASTPKITELSLGKVVVYRNGVAFFERYTDVADGEFTVLIAQSRVNDLLKSLKVEDAASGKLLAVSFPGNKEGSGVIRMRIGVPKGTRRVKLSYVSESPAWKPSYRINLEAEGKMTLQGWAIVDNVSGEDWENVAIAVGSTSALSFRYDLWSVRDVHRQTLKHSQRLAVAPPMATGLAREEVKTQVTSEALVLDRAYVDNLPVAGRTFVSTLAIAAGAQDAGIGISFSGSSSLENQYVVDGVNTSSGARSYVRSDEEIEAERKRKEFYHAQKQVRASEGAKRKRRQDELAQELLNSSGVYLVEGVSSPSDKSGGATALSMANHLRNELINRGVAPLRLRVTTRVGGMGEPTSLSVVPLEQEGGTSDQEITGESRFLAFTSVSIPDNGSSLVAVLDEETAGEVAYLYDPSSLRGNQSFAFRAIKFTNPTDQYLESGPVTVFGGDSFIGEGLTGAMAPGGVSILPYALDRQVYVERSEEFVDTVTGLRSIAGEGAIVRQNRVKTLHYEIHNRLNEEVTVYIRHDSNQGWKFLSGPGEVQQMGAMSVFPVHLQIGERKRVSLTESTPIVSTLDLSSDEGVKALTEYLIGSKANAAFSKAGRELAVAYRSIQKKLKMINRSAGRLVILRHRLREVHAQVVTLEAVRARGKASRSLQDRMQTLSKQVQDATFEVIDLREEIMVERFAYRDLIEVLADGKSQSLSAGRNGK